MTQYFLAASIKRSEHFKKAFENVSVLWRAIFLRLLIFVLPGYKPIEIKASVSTDITRAFHFCQTLFSLELLLDYEC